MRAPKSQPKGAGMAAFGLWMAAAFTVAEPVRAEEATSANVAPPVAASAPRASDPLHQAPLTWPDGPRRRFALLYDPFSIALSRYGLTLQLIPVSHHALILTGYYMYTNTNSDSNNNFRGGGGEIGYHYFFGHNGPRGLHIGPSFLLGHFDGVHFDDNHVQSGDAVHFFTWGVAADIGWQAILLDRLVLGVSAGVQYEQPTVSTNVLPIQELPAGYYTNRGVHPRLQIHVGFAF